MKVEVHDERYEPPAQLRRTGKLILTREEYDNLKAAFCKGKGWSLDYPHTINVSSITLTGNYKWLPASSVQFQINLEDGIKIKE
jgi:hypothetical protein